MKFFGFSKREILTIFIILGFLGGAVYTNLSISLRKGRDSQRKNDLWIIYEALVAYHGKRSGFPPSFDGKIDACEGPCEWQKNGLIDPVTGDVYLKNLPTDPKHDQGVRYHYISNGRYFQIYGALESPEEDEYDEAIVARSISCGSRVCNFGKGFMGTPLDKSIEEYENELRGINENK